MPFKAQVAQACRPDQRCEDVDGFAGFAVLLGRGHVRDGAHAVEPAGEADGQHRLLTRRPGSRPCGLKGETARRDRAGFGGVDGRHQLSDVLAEVHDHTARRAGQGVASTSCTRALQTTAGGNADVGDDRGDGETAGEARVRAVAGLPLLPEGRHVVSVRDEQDTGVRVVRTHDGRQDAVQARGGAVAPAQTGRQPPPDLLLPLPHQRPTRRPPSPGQAVHGHGRPARARRGPEPSPRSSPRLQRTRVESTDAAAVPVRPKRRTLPHDPRVPTQLPQQDPRPDRPDRHRPTPPGLRPPRFRRIIITEPSAASRHLTSHRSSPDTRTSTPPWATTRSTRQQPSKPTTAGEADHGDGDSQASVDLFSEPGAQAEGPGQDEPGAVQADKVFRGEHEIHQRPHRPVPTQQGITSLEQRVASPGPTHAQLRPEASHFREDVPPHAPARQAHQHGPRADHAAAVTETRQHPRLRHTQKTPTSTPCSAKSPVHARKGQPSRPRSPPSPTCRPRPTAMMKP